MAQKSFLDLFNDAYFNENYAKVVKIWEVYKDKYESKVAKNPYMNFVVCDSFIKLGLFKSYDRALGSLKSCPESGRAQFPYMGGAGKKYKY